MNSKWLYWSAQWIGWLSYACLLYLATYAKGAERIDRDFFINVFSLIFFGIFWTHLMRSLFLRLKWLDLKLPRLLPRILVVSLLFALLISVSSDLVSMFTDPETFKSVTFIDLTINVFAVMILVLFWNSIYFTWHYFQQARKREMDNLALLASRNESELKNLRAQLNPHFLFNSLNSIRALIDSDPVKARELTTLLSNLLRSNLLMGKEDLVSLADELKLVHNYLEMEKIRFEERLQVNWLVDESLLGVKIPPFSIQTLVENAIKHGISKQIEGGKLEVEVLKTDGKLMICVTNTGNLLDVAPETGIGLENIRKRLELQYGNQATVLLREAHGKVKAIIEMKEK